MEQDADNFKCKHYLFYKARHVDNKTILRPLPVFTKPQECVIVDMVSPITLPNNEQKWFMMVQDCFSKEIIIRKLTNYSGVEWSRTFEQEVLWPKDNPEHVISDSLVLLF
eukprot:TRINITY_DN4020_c0_g1_i12.p1 TRINITY_DN4020_c0_g1~~TRINITY_DN4020_c0_g1_i12.p1  ORF type:complete len:110 (+),score=13.55 TRINITY_DN4020_c0_g1_i12:911-1240(+)